MEKPFRWNLFWNTIGSLGLMVGLFVLLFNSAMNIEVFLGVIFFGLVGTWIGIFVLRKYQEYLWILGIIMLVLLAILAEFMFSILDDNRYDEVYSITLIIFLFGYLVLLYRNKLYEVMWAIVTFILSMFVFVATLAIELIIHPPSEE